MSPHLKSYAIFMTTLAVVVSCSSGYKRPESFSDKMNRFTAKAENNTSIPKLSMIKYQVGQRSRGPASMPAQDQMTKALSNKRLYFLSLYSQYNEFGQYSNTTTPAIEICPNFHSSMIDHKEKYGSGNTGKKSLVDTYTSLDLTDVDELVTKKPELLLPVSLHENGPTVLDLFKNTKTHESRLSIVQMAVNIHVTKIYNELTELCEYGSSDNYYKYENLVSQIGKEQKFSATRDNFQILLKTTIFTNQVLISSVKTNDRGASRSIASSIQKNTDYSQEVINRLRASWSQDYLATLKNTK